MLHKSKYLLIVFEYVFNIHFIPFSNLQNSLDPVTVSRILSTFPEQSVSYIGKLLAKVKATILLSVSKRLSFRTKSYISNKMAMLQIVVTTSFTLFDLIKDSLILVQISLSQGGIALIMKQQKAYIRGVSIL